MSDALFAPYVCKPSWADDTINVPAGSRLLGLVPGEDVAVAFLVPVLPGGGFGDTVRRRVSLLRTMEFEDADRLANLRYLGATVVTAYQRRVTVFVFVEEDDDRRGAIPAVVAELRGDPS